MDWSDIWRAVNGVLAVIAFVLVLIYMCKVHGVMTTRMRILVYALMLLLFTCAIAAVENVIEDNDFGIRDGFISVSCIWVIYGLRFMPPSITKEYIKLHADLDRKNLPL